jgi:alanine racemase
MKTKKIKNFRNKTSKVYSIPSYDKDIVGVIDVNAIRKNINYLKKKSGTDLMPVLKADAYGHGAVEMAKILRSLGIKYIGVATLGEAIMLRDSGDKGRILAWLYDVNGDELKQALHMDIDIAIFDEKTIPKFISLIPKNKKINVTMFVDTGINRAGISYDKAYDAFIEVSKCDNIKIEGMMSHLVSSGVKNSPIVNEQLRKFRDLRKRLSEINIVPPLVHIANTGGCLNYDVSDFTLARPGSGIYGVGGDDKYSKFLSLAMTVKSYIIQIKDIDKGEGIGYDWKYVTPRKMKIAILPIGYADIIPRSTSEKLYVYINGTKRKVLGTISMDQIMVEAKNNDKISDDAIIFGNGVNCPQTIFDIADESDILSLEILCHTGYRINREYINK